jgi:AcrR family transcriptional regulator
MPKVVPEYKDQARKRIVEAARVVFRRKGFRKATMDDIAREIGVSKGALYLYFPTKADLLVQIQSRAREEILQHWERLLEAGDVAEGMADSLDQVFSGHLDPAIFHELVAESASDPEVRRAILKDRRDDSRLLRRFLQELENRGRIPKMRDSVAVTEIVLKLFEGTVLQMLLQGEGSDARKTLVRELRLVLGL